MAADTIEVPPVEEPTNNYINIMRGTEIVGRTTDGVPTDLQTDQEFTDFLFQFMENVVLTPKQKMLICQCMNVLTSEMGEEINFGVREVLALAKLANANPEYAPNLLACSSHLVSILDFDNNDVPEDINLRASVAMGAFGDLYAKSMQDLEDGNTLGSSSDDEGSFEESEEQIEEGPSELVPEPSTSEAEGTSEPPLEPSTSVVEESSESIPETSTSVVESAK